MSKDFSTDRKAVKDTATKFEDLSGDYKALMDAAGLGLASTGDGEIDGVLDTALRTIGELHLMLTQAIYQHGGKLHFAASNVDSVEDDLGQLMDKIFTAAEFDPIPPPNARPDSPLNFGGDQGG